MPNSAVRSFSDPWEFQESVKGSDLKVLISAPGDYKSELTRIDMRQIQLQRAETVLPQVTHAAVEEGRSAIYFLADPQQTPIHQNGLELEPGVIVASSSGAEHYRRMSTGTRWASMSLTLEDLASAAQTMVDWELTVPAPARLIRPSPPLMSRLLALHEAAGQLAAIVPDILAHAEVCRAIEHELMHLMVRCLTEGQVLRTDSPRHQRRLVMRRFEDFLDANPGMPVYLPDVCAAIGVPDRTLRAHCEEQVGMGPHKYLWLRRMNLARRALLMAEPATATVTVIALDHGFGELGRFAVAYRELFGESPSATIRRPRTMPG
jgi:AraC-like DNA-binding protein